MPFDGDDTRDPAPVQGFFGSDQENQDGHAEDGDYRGDDDFCGGGEGGSVGGDTDRHIDGGTPGPGRRTFVSFDPTRGPNESY